GFHTGQTIGGFGAIRLCPEPGADSCSRSDAPETSGLLPAGASPLHALESNPRLADASAGPAQPVSATLARPPGVTRKERELELIASVRIRTSVDERAADAGIAGEGLDPLAVVMKWSANVLTCAELPRDLIATEMFVVMGQ